MKYMLAAAVVSLFIACKNHHEDRSNPKEILKLVDEGNDGWNAFPISLSDDSTFKIEYFSFGDPDIETGKYFISQKSIFVSRQNSRRDEITFDQTSSGCLYNVKYVSGDRTINMRVVFDSMFCNHSYDKQLTGKWRYQNAELVSDTLQLNSDGTARFKGKDYREWDFNNPRLTISWDNMSAYLFIGDLKEDSLLFSTSWPFGEVDSIKAFRIK